MPLVTWSNAIAIGIPSLDGQHQRWIGLINDLDDAMMARQGRDVLGGTLKSMVAYTRTHFASEEALMAKHAFPDYASHKRLHEEFIARVDEMEAHQQAASGIMTSDVMDSLKDWLVNHRQKVDRQYVAYLKANGVQ